MKGDHCRVELLVNILHFIGYLPRKIWKILCINSARKSSNTEDLVEYRRESEKVETNSSPCPIIEKLATREGSHSMNHQACYVHNSKILFRGNSWKLLAQINSETKSATQVLHKVNYSSQKINDTLKSTQAPAILSFRGLTSQSSLSPSLWRITPSMCFLKGVFGRIRQEVCNCCCDECSEISVDLCVNTFESCSGRVLVCQRNESIELSIHLNLWD